MSEPGEVVIRLQLNGRAVACGCAPTLTAVALLRERLGLTGTKLGCGVGDCGACTILVGDAPWLACLLLAAELDGTTVTTIEGLSAGGLSPLQRAFLAETGVQCGFCTPGMIVAATAIDPDADDATIREALAGNICRCTGYRAIVAAVSRAACER